MRQIGDKKAVLGLWSNQLSHGAPNAWKYICTVLCHNAVLCLNHKTGIIALIQAGKNMACTRSNSTRALMGSFPNALRARREKHIASPGQPSEWIGAGIPCILIPISGSNSKFTLKSAFLQVKFCKILGQNLKNCTVHARAGLRSA